MTDDEHSKSSSNFFDRALTQFQRHALVKASKAWDNITGTARALTGNIDKDLPKSDAERLLKQMEECYDSKGGEVTARRNTVELGYTYLSLSDKGKERFLKMLSREFDIDRQELQAALHNCLDAQGTSTQEQTEHALRHILKPRRMKILRQFSALPDGIKFLVDMRADLLQWSKKQQELGALELDMRKLLSSWFDIGLLDLQEITWNSPASLLEKLIAYEAVHQIQSWSDLKNRLDSDRRCFAFFHYKMPDEPLIFVEVALVNGVAKNIGELLDESQPLNDPAQADTAIFYSISNAQKGLAGISLGNFLIKRVVDRLSREFGNLKQFATLSPIPGFRKWLDKALASQGKDVFLAVESRQLKTLGNNSDPVATLKELLASNWHEDKDASVVLKKILKRLCAHYLLHEKRNDHALDPVANFHLSNGAKLESLNWLADTSEKGLAQSAGMMVNYHYELSKIDDNHERYTEEGVIACSKTISGLS